MSIYVKANMETNMVVKASRPVVIPLHKRSDATEAANYRPVTSVPIMCKIIEKIIHKQLAS